MSLAASIGLVRFPDLLSRMHSATKPQVLGLLLMLVALALMLRSWALIPVLILAWVFQLLTAPVSAHMVGRAGYRTKHLRKELLSIDELEQVVEAAAAYQANDYDAAAMSGVLPEEVTVDSIQVPPAEDENPAARRPETQDPDEDTGSENGEGRSSTS